jgi:hypothetical protein
MTKTAMARPAAIRRQFKASDVKNISPGQSKGHTAIADTWSLQRSTVLFREFAWIAEMTRK